MPLLHGAVALHDVIHAHGIPFGSSSLIRSLTTPPLNFYSSEKTDRPQETSPFKNISNPISIMSDQQSNAIDAFANSQQEGVRAKVPASEPMTTTGVSNASILSPTRAGNLV